MAGKVRRILLTVNDNLLRWLKILSQAVPAGDVLHVHAVQYDRHHL